MREYLPVSSPFRRSNSVRARRAGRATQRPGRVRGGSGAARCVGCLPRLPSLALSRAGPPDPAQLCGVVCAACSGIPAHSNCLTFHIYLVCRESNTSKSGRSRAGAAAGLGWAGSRRRTISAVGLLVLCSMADGTAHGRCGLVRRAVFLGRNCRVPGETRASHATRPTRPLLGPHPGPPERRAAAAVVQKLTPPWAVWAPRPASPHPAGPPGCRRSAAQAGRLVHLHRVAFLFSCRGAVSMQVVLPHPSAVPRHAMATPWPRCDAVAELQPPPSPRNTCHLSFSSPKHSSRAAWLHA